MRKGKQLINRVLASFLAAALVLTGLYVPQMEAEAAEDGLIVHYDFVSQNDQAAQIPDASMHGNIAEIKAVSGSARGKYEIVDANIYGKQVKALDLVGGADGAYLTLPAGILSNCDSVTISTWVKLTTDSGYQRIWDFGTGQNSYMYLLSDGGNDGFKGYASAITTSGWGGETGVQKGENFAKNRWVLTTVVMDGSTMSLYENGELIGTKDTKIKVKDLGNTENNYIAYGQFGNDPAAGQFAEFKIYNKALSAAEIKAMYNVTDDGILSSDVSDLSLGDISGITENMELPAKGINGSDITWTSNNEAIAVGDKNEVGNYVATVKRPAQGTADAKVELTATLTYNGKSSTKKFTVNVVAEYTDLQKVYHDLEIVKQRVGNLSTIISKEISLPADGDWGSAISWRWKGDRGVISIPAEQDGNGSFKATVNRPTVGQPDKTGILKGKVASGDEYDTVEIPITVKAFRESATIKSFEEIAVSTQAGHSPSLPNYVKATYSDNSINKLKVRWPDAIEAEKYAAAGQFDVEGEVIGEANTFVTAHVTVVSAAPEPATAKTANFDLNDISLDKLGQNGSILTQNRDRDIAYLKLLDNKRMLYDFYMTFGEDDKIKDVKPLGGWDDPTGLLRGHSTGHYMSALALAYASTGDEELKTKLNEMVSELHRLQQKSKGNAQDFKISGSTMEDSLDVNTWSKDPNEWGEGFISAYSPDQFALLEVYAPYGSPGSGIWAPYYTLHKLLAGFLDAYTYTGNEEALVTAKALGKWVYNRLSACSQEQLTKMWGMYIAGELGGFNESMAQLYIYAKAGNDPDADIYLKGAKLFDNTKFFDNLEKNTDDIKGRHANQHIPQIIGALKIYEASVEKGSAEKKYFDIAENFWQMTVSRYGYSIGGVGVGEAFPEAPYTQAANIMLDRNCETCAAYNMLKLTKMLNNYDPEDAEYMDYYERTLYNQILASQTPNVTDNMHNGTTYMLPIGPGVRRSFGGDYDSFTCCHGTGMENHVKYQEAAYVKTANELYVGLYLPSTLTWQDKGVKVVQETSFPSSSTKMTVSELAGASSQAFDMKLRVPYWATNGFTVKVNGETKVENPEISTYVTLTGIKAGDVITVDMPWTLHLDKTPDKIGSSMAASVMYGPFVMAAKNDSTEWQNLVLPENLEDLIEVGTNEENGFPTLSASGYSFAPMFAPEYATEAYHTYFKVLIQKSDGSAWHEVKVTNNTPANGSVTTTATAEMVKEGDDLTITALPNEGFAVSKLVVNGEEVTVEDNKYVVKEVKEDVQIEVTFRPPVLNEDNLEYSADVSADQESDYGKITDVMRGNPTQSADWGRGWSNWWKNPGDDCYLQYTWDEPVTMNTFDIFWRNLTSGNGNNWLRVPATLKIMYLDKDGKTWKEANMISKYQDIIELDKFNTVKFDTIETTAVRLAMTTAPQSECTGVQRWVVSLKEADKAALAASIANAADLKAGEYTKVTWDQMKVALAEAEAIKADKYATQSQADQAASELNNAIAALQAVVSPDNGVEKTNLKAAITVVGNLKAGDYTSETWKKVKAALFAAAKVNEDANAAKDNVDAAAADLDAAVQALTEKEATPEGITKASLENAIAKANYLRPSDYTGATWSGVSAALAEAEAVNESADETQDQVDAAVKALRDAIAALVKNTAAPAGINKEALRDAIDSIANLNEREYTQESWNSLQAALKAATDLNESANATQAQIDAAVTPLSDAAAALAKLDRSALKTAIASAEAKLAGKEEKDYTADSWKVVNAALAEAKGVYKKVSTNASEITAAVTALANAGELVALDRTALKTAIDAAENKIKGKTEKDFTAESWKKVTEALKEAKKVYENVSVNQKDVDDAVTALNNAGDLEALDRAGLKTAIEAAQAKLTGKSEKDYTADSWEAIEDAINAAMDVYEKVSVTKKEIDDAKTALASLGDLVSLDRGALKNAIDAANTKLNGKTEKDYTADSWKIYQAALDKVKETEGKVSVNPKNIERVAEELTSAVDKLVLLDRSKLTAAIAKAEKLKKGDYTTATWKTMQTALSVAKTVNEKISLNQDEVDTAEKGLTAAIKALEKLAVKPATPTSVKAAWAGVKKVTVTWKAAKNATKYEVYRSYSKKGKYVKLGATSKKTYTDKKATPGKTAYYKVIAYNGKLKGSYSKIVSTSILKAPAKLKATVKKAGKKKNVTLSFGKVKGASGYEIYKATKKNGKYKKVATLNKGKTVKKVFKNAKKGTCFYKVKAYKQISKKKKVYTALSSALKVKVK
ncbi:MAG: hypothetical protein HFH36_08265 [Lachnospiraceae bacterium]|nr:hypothetical protein [Lachnospiraceae bacterium]